MRDWRLEAKLGATVVQPCVVTAEPVTTRIDDPVTRRYLAQMPEPQGDEVEMPEDDSAEPLPDVLDLSAVMAEALALALPLYLTSARCGIDPDRVRRPGCGALDRRGCPASGRSGGAP